MCGIVGVAASAPVANREWLGAACHTLMHRGPDDVGQWWSIDGQVGLGHRRLAIIDRSPAGHQPMLHFRAPRDGAPAGLTSLVFNGEIYNFQALRAELEQGFRFQSHSDTEAILAAYEAWGPGCVERLHGMFAFALYDAPRRRMLLARDRAGEKPLFYRLDAGGLRFASELKALFADSEVPRRIDPSALDAYLAEGFIAGSASILEGTRKLPPAHALTFDLHSGELRTWRYWNVPRVPADAADEGELVDQLDTVLEAAVRRQLVADVPVGVLLSGGLDSSLVTAMAVRSAPAIKTFTVRFPGHGRYDETGHARLIATHFGTEHVELTAEPITVDLLPRLAAQYDEPIVDSSMIPTYLVTHLVRQHCTVALGGDGGDELFGGYATYDRLLRLQRNTAMLPLPLRQAIATAGAALLPVGAKSRRWVQQIGADFDEDVPFIGCLFDRATRRRLMGTRWPLVAEDARSARRPREGSLIDRLTRMDFENYLPEDVLVKVDRASMLNSVEVRAPFLDVAVIEFAFGKVPSSLKATTQERKRLLKVLARRILPPAFDEHRKQGFSIPIDNWLRSDGWQEFFRGVLLDPQQTLFNHRVLGELLDAQRRGASNGERLFGLVMFELWRRAYRPAM
jgi:asparagine synthase (glutamine-hydrolysing)